MTESDEIDPLSLCLGSVIERPSPADVNALTPAAPPSLNEQGSLAFPKVPKLSISDLQLVKPESQQIAVEDVTVKQNHRKSSEKSESGDEKDDSEEKTSRSLSR